jgi:oxygen-independent coproporphyrinogen III oxidase
MSVVRPCARSTPRSSRANQTAIEPTRGSTELAATPRDVVARSDQNFQTADYGFWLDEEDRRRRYVIQSLLQVEGLDLAAYRATFATDVWSDLPELGQLPSHGWAQFCDDRLQLTPAGLERSDLIGPWLYSEKVNRRMDEYPLR